MEPAEREQLALGFLQRACYRRHGDSYGHYFVVGIFYNGYHSHVEQREIRLYVLVYLFSRHSGVSEQRRVCLVYKVEDAVGQVCLAYFLSRLDFVNVQVAAFHHYVGYPLVSVRHALRHKELFLYPVGLLFVSQRFHVLGIIRIVVYRGHCRQLVESFYKHSFCIDVGKSERSHDIGHSALFSPVCHGVEKSLRHLPVVNEVYPAKAHVLGVPCIVGPFVDYCSHPSCKSAVFVGKEVIGFAEIESRVFLFRERAKHVLVQIGHGVGVVPV